LDEGGYGKSQQKWEHARTSRLLAAGRQAATMSPALRPFSSAFGGSIPTASLPLVSFVLRVLVDTGIFCQLNEDAQGNYSHSPELYEAILISALPPEFHPIAIGILS
jgi:hypothetical protein